MEMEIELKMENVNNFLTKMESKNVKVTFPIFILKWNEKYVWILSHISYIV